MYALVGVCCGSLLASVIAWSRDVVCLTLSAIAFHSGSEIFGGLIITLDGWGPVTPVIRGTPGRSAGTVLGGNVLPAVGALDASS